MRRARKHQRTPAAAALALLGMAFYVLIVPWHSVSSLDRLLAAAANDLAGLHVYCFGTSSPDGSPLESPSDGSSDTHCPLCQAHVPFSFAIEQPATALPHRPDLQVAFDPLHQEAAIAASDIVPNSRGPPHA